MKEIGGYFGLELTKGPGEYHKEALRFKSGRSSLNYILQYTQAEKVFIPYFSCDALAEPLLLRGIPYEYYSINEALEPRFVPQLKRGEYFLYINYFDLKRDYCTKLSQELGEQLIIDNTQAFFQKGDGLCWSFNSCRKFFGTPDGSYLYVPSGSRTSVEVNNNEDYLVGHLISRLEGKTREGYALFVENESRCGGEMKGMSTFSSYLLSNIDYEDVSKRRRQNFKELKRLLGKYLLVEYDSHEAVPMSFPALIQRKIDRTELDRQGIYVPRMWREVLNRGYENYSNEKMLATKLFALPIDHRYSLNDMRIIDAAITTLLNEKTSIH